MSANILIVDDHEIFRRGVMNILMKVPDAFVIDEANTGQEAIKKIWENQYNLVILDISMPGRNGIDILKQIKGYRPDLKVLILSMYPEEQFAVRALKSGASGYLTKACAPEELITAIKKILKGSKYISASLADSLLCYVEKGNKQAPHEILSDREYEVMCMTAAGKSVKQIATELSLSDKTISTYRARILNKMNMDNITHLIQHVIQNKLIDQYSE